MTDRDAAVPSHADETAAGASPLWALIATMAMQMLATMAAFSMPAIAPAVARDTGVDGALVGYFIATIYGVGIVSAIVSPSLIRRYGAVRVSQAVMLSVLAMLAIVAIGGLAAFALGAVLLGLTYGATAPASTHLLVPRAKAANLNLLLSIRQVGVPLGGVLAALILPPIVVVAGWRPALLLQLPPSLLLLLLLELPRRRWDADREPRHPFSLQNALRPLRLLGESAELRRLSLVGFTYSGIQLCFIGFMTVHLTKAAGLDLIQAGLALAVYQGAGVISRPVWGWIADRFVAARWLLVLHGFGMAAAAIASARFDPAWPGVAIMLVAAVAGATASGFTGIAYAEYARLGGSRRTEATGLGASAMFSGVMLLPAGFSLLVGLSQDYGLAYGVMAALACVSATVLALPAAAAQQ